ncbi:MAG TPA: hypothetical protein VFM82_04950 [Flavobacteriaceae bacterium]|nr:hypothetical protein [Flavobacteriaceae bacterium]
MTEKEHEPKKNKAERERFPKDMKYNPDITKADKNVLNNQSAEEKMDGNFKNRKKPVDYTGEGLDIPKGQDNKLEDKPVETEASTRKKRPKESANSQNQVPSAETIYKGEDAKKYRDPSKKTRD